MSDSRRDAPDPARRRLLATGAAITSGLATAPLSALRSKDLSVPAFEFEETTIAELQKRMSSGELTARALAESYLKRIHQVDKQGPKINSVIELNPDALAIASSLDAERKSKEVRGALHGIPVLIKDNIGTADRMMTTAGSLALMNFTPANDAGIVKRLRQAGAVILGKTNLSEWANFRSSHSSSGWSGRGGQTHNPYALDRNPCGSSSGSGAAVSANLCAASVGTETDGSIVCPSSANGVVGVKPTVGLLSRAGIIPISHTQDTPGPICRTLTDAAALLSAMAGYDPLDQATEGLRGKTFDYSKYLDPAGLKGARIGVVRKAFDLTEADNGVLDEAIRAMKNSGAAIVDDVTVATLGKFDDSELLAMLYEFKADLNAYLAAAPKAPVHSLAEIIEFNERNREKEMPYFGQDLFTRAQASGPLTDKAYRDAVTKNHRLAREEGIDATLAAHRLDALVALTAGPSWLIDPVDGDHDTGGSSSLAAVAGCPSVSVPAGSIFGLPVGISFFGAAWSEWKLIRIAYAFELATRVRKPPRFLPTALVQGRPA